MRAWLPQIGRRDSSLRLSHVFVYWNLPAVATNTIDNIKGMIKGFKGIPVKEQRLIFKDTQLEDGSMTLSDYNIPEKSTIYLSLRGRGGGNRARADTTKNKEALLKELRDKVDVTLISYIVA